MNLKPSDIREVYPHFRHEMLYYATMTHDILSLEQLSFYDGFDIDSKAECAVYLDQCLAMGSLIPIGTDAVLRKIYGKEVRHE